MCDLTKIESAERKATLKREKKIVKDPEALKAWLFGGSGEKVDVVQTVVKIKSDRISRNNSDEFYLKDDGTKKCRCCGNTIIAEGNFYKSDATIDGYRRYCIPCFKEDANNRYYRKKEKNKNDI